MGGRIYNQKQPNIQHALKLHELDVALPVNAITLCIQCVAAPKRVVWVARDYPAPQTRLLRTNLNTQYHTKSFEYLEIHC